MKTILFSFLCCGVQGGPDDGIQLYQQGKYLEAAAAFRRLLASDPDSAELHYNLALSLWRAGDLTGAEDEAERYAAAPGGGRVDLHRGLIGNVRYAEAEALAGKAEAPAAPPLPPPPSPNVAPGTPPAAPPDPVALLEQALAKAMTARDEFVRGVAAPGAGAELARNAERALQLAAELQKKLDEAKKQREQQDQKDQKDQKEKKDQKDQKDQKNDQGQQDKQDQRDQKNDKEQKDNQDKKDANQQQKPDQPEKQPQEKPEPKPPEQGQEKPEPKPPEQGQEKPEPKPQAQQQDKEQQAGQPPPRSDAPGEQTQVTELSPEQKQRLLDQLQQLDQQLKAIRAKAGANKKPVERDW